MKNIDKIKLKNAIQNHDYITRKHLTQWESINEKINNRQSFEMFIEMYSLYLDLNDKFKKLKLDLWISNYELDKFQQMIS